MDYSLPDFGNIHKELDRAREILREKKEQHEKGVQELTTAIIEGRQGDYDRLKESLQSEFKFDDGTQIRSATLKDLTLPLQTGWDMSHLSFKGVTFAACSSVNSIIFSRSHFEGCQFIKTRIAKSAFDGCVLSGCTFENASAIDCEFKDCKFKDCNFDGAVTLNGDFTTASLENLDLSTVTFGRSTGLIGAYAASLLDVRHADRARYSWRYDACSWAHLRTAGALPLFGASYIGIIAIWSLVSAADLVQRYGTWFNNDALPKEAASGVALALAPPHLGLTFVALCFLALAATLYRVFCPSEIQEFSEARWALELNQPLLRYRVLAYQLPPLRWITAISYLVSVPWLLFLLSRRMVETIAYFL
jgi:uncharacterized protein YjbI with pentapeptide repeats